MTERKKPGVTFESFVDKQIREAQEKGAFSNLEGAGKPIPRGDGRDDEMWWIKGYLRRENLSTDALLPESLQLRREIERLPSTLADLRFEDSVREQLGELNARVVAWIRMPSPPLIPLSPVDVDEWVGRWKTRRAAAENAVSQAPAQARATIASVEEPRRWWQRRRRRRQTRN